MRRVSVVLCLFFVFPLLKCVENYTEKVKQLSHFNRYKVEELLDDFNTAKSEDDQNLNLVAFLVQNAKEIFGETEETTFTFKISPRRTESTQSFIPNSSRTTNFIKFINSINLDSATSASTTATTTISTEDRLLVLNMTRPLEISSITTSDSTIITEFPTDLTTEHFTDFFTESTINVKAVRETLFNLTNTVVIKPSRTIMKPQRTEGISEEDSLFHNELSTIATRNNPQHTRSCIECNNVESKQCNNPEPKLARSVKCSHEEDLCYSQQTPFGIIDRGCFNINRNITTYVCACNLCNYISISEMPYVFTKKQEWVDNVIDLTRTKGFRTSIYKDMLCLSCEVNTTETTFNMAYTANCLEGNIHNSQSTQRSANCAGCIIMNKCTHRCRGVLKTQKCTDDEICGVKALKHEGYVWRGCLKSPLYNYWWSLCDSDLCNHDPLFTLYDPLL